MSLKKSDYYYGAVVSHVIKYGVCPVILGKPVDSRRVYSIMTDQISCVLSAKYAVQKNSTHKGKRYLWKFVLSDQEKDEI
jgi:hypothetical protein